MRMEVPAFNHNNKSSDGRLNLKCNRRQLAVFSPVSFLFSLTLTSKTDAEAADLRGAVNKYIKRKKLDPLDTYVTPLLLSQLQLQDIEVNLLSDKPSYVDARSLLRSGPIASLRIDIRAVAQYASEAGNSQGVSDDIDQCLRALEEVDSILLRATRNEFPASPEIFKDKIHTVLFSLDRLLGTVPTQILEKCRKIITADKDESATEWSDVDIKALESLL